MTAQKLDGTATAAAIKAELKIRVAALRERGVVPGLGTCWSATTPARTGTSAASTRTAPRSASTRSGATCRPTATQAEVEAVVDELNADPACTGLPRPAAAAARLDENRAALGVIDPDKDVDGLHPTNLGWLVLGKAGAAAVHARSASIELLRRHDVPIAGAEVVVVGRGVTVGRPLGLLLTRRSRERHGHPVPHRHPRPGRARPPGRHRGRRGRRARHHHRRHGQARRRRARRRRLPGRRQDRRRRRRRRLGRRRLGVAEPRRRRPDDPRDAAVQHRRHWPSRRWREPCREACRERRPGAEEPLPDDVPHEDRAPRATPRRSAALFYLVVLAGDRRRALASSWTGDWRIGVSWIGGALIFAGAGPAAAAQRDAGMLAVRAAAGSTCSCSPASGARPRGSSSTELDPADSNGPS